MKRIVSAAAAAAALWSSASASAGLLTVTDIGTVVGSYDGLGLFGTPGANLNDDSYMAVFTFDLSKATGFFNNGSQAYAEGGLTFGGSPSFVSEVLTINGVSAPSFGSFASEILAYNFGASSGQYQFAESAYGQFDSPIYYTGKESSADYYFALNGSITFDFTMPGKYTSANYMMYGYFNAYSETVNVDTGSLDGNWTSVDATLSSVTVSVPEPSTWAMMLAGFVGVGLAGSRAARKGTTLL